MPLSTDQQAEIDQARDGTQPTRRAVVPALEEILYQALPALDHGFVRVVDYMGDDAAV
ncbi:MAG: thymidylate synthase (FAD), partial [Alphaproteobacteria bacterium]|nr:thymidylate synthase (FAD) [Alphaproteobacteria bacterium]